MLRERGRDEKSKVISSASQRQVKGISGGKDLLITKELCPILCAFNLHLPLSSRVCDKNLTIKNILKGRKGIVFILGSPTEWIPQIALSLSPGGLFYAQRGPLKRVYIITPMRHTIKR